MKNLVALFIAILLPMLVIAQNDVEFGLFGGFVNYQGDLAENDIQFNEFNPSISGFLRYHVHPNISVRANLGMAKLTGDDKNNPNLADRSFRFENKLIELTAMGELYMIQRGQSYEFDKFKPLATPYFLAGLGVAFGKPEAECYSADCLAGENPFPEDGVQSGYFCLPVGIGFRFEPTRELAIGMELVYRATFSDFLDGISENANPDKNDWYFKGGLTLSYIFGN